MDITIIGTESLGVRGLSCMVETGARRILIDPGVALGYLRHGHLPHPCQVAVGAAIRENILAAIGEATDIVISHYHGDHVPLADANPYQLSLARIPPLEDVRFWCRGTTSLSFHSLRRREAIEEHLGHPLPESDGTEEGILSFSVPVPHGSPQSHLGRVMMTCIRDEERTFVHASDIQMLNREAVAIIRAWEPDVVFAAGPPLYLLRLTEKERLSAWENALSVAEGCGTLILDHHVRRSLNGCRWAEKLSEEAGGNVVSAADFMGREPLLLEARREELYQEYSVPEGWHDAYAKGEAGLENFMNFVEMVG
ncbi:MBL fold metallo-hydrolase [Methanogenium marinum]|uniref:MBL fold metallo-hydrolase n=1 Tax=Methanogenium marinum TaxID=348610 RepID=A0A9Q4PWD7_9EURY|nr:MBL fold metallo-hydrolase [Methanogenium marinum]MDE4908529.1 MBL fold metallo-hydrolase [Methanogenium marinum]